MPQNKWQPKENWTRIDRDAVEPEVVTQIKGELCSVHIERMSDGEYWMRRHLCSLCPGLRLCCMSGDDQFPRDRHPDKAIRMSPEKAVKRRTVQYLSDCGKIIAMVGDSPDAMAELILLLGRAGHSYAGIAKEIGVTQNSIWRWARKDRPPRKKTVIRAYIAGLNKLLAQEIAKLEAEL